MMLIFVQNLRTIPVSAEEQSLKLSVKVMNKTAASATQFASALRFNAVHAFVQLQLPAA